MPVLPVLPVLIITVMVLILLTAVLKLNAFIALLLSALLSGFLLGMPAVAIVQSVQKGVGDMLGQVLIVLCAGAMIGRLVAASGAAKVIADKIMQHFGHRWLQWGLVLAGLVIGIPLFYNVGFVLVVPVIFSLVYQYRLPVVYVAVPMLASLSVAHSLLPPHPSPATLVGMFGAGMGKTFLYGIIVAVPAVILAGPIFSKTLKKIKAPVTAVAENPIAVTPPGFGISVLSAMFPIFLLLCAAVLQYAAKPAVAMQQVIAFVAEPSILMLIALLAVSYFLGIRQGLGVAKMMQLYEEGIKDIAMIVLIIGASGALKQVLVDSNAAAAIAAYFGHVNMHPLILGWLIAAIIRLCLGSATVAGLTAAGIIAPAFSGMAVQPELMILAIGSGSVFFSHVNDTGFWMFKSYFNVSLKVTFLSWSLMETIVSVTGLAGVLLLHFFL
jgi:Gnt-I system high-affinity gluconate transporter